MKLTNFLAKNAFRLALLLLLILPVLYLLSMPAKAPTIEKLTNQAQNDGIIANSGVFEQDSAGKAIDDTSVASKSYLIYDNSNTGTALASRHPSSVVSIASLTKLMTAYLTYKYGNLSEIVTIKPNNTLNINPVLGLATGDRILVEDLVNSILIGSANDAALTLGAYLETKTEQPIADLMNKEADELGMDDTQYHNPIGFDSDTNYSTAKDVALLIKALERYQDFSVIGRKQSYSFTSQNSKNFSIKATNKLIATNADITAIKTGYTDDAQGAMVVSVTTSAEGVSRKFYIIVLQSPQRETDTLILRDQINKILSTK